MASEKTEDFILTVDAPPDDQSWDTQRSREVRSLGLRSTLEASCSHTNGCLYIGMNPARTFLSTVLEHKAFCEAWPHVFPRPYRLVFIFALC